MNSSCFNHFGNLEKTIFLDVTQILINNLLKTERRKTEWQTLATEFFVTFLNIGTTDEAFHQSGKQHSINNLF